MELYPLLMSPSFRHGPATPWGGHALKEKYGKDAPEDVTGESLEISALPGCESYVSNGEHLGKTLSDVFSLWGSRLTGNNEKTFPLLLKLLDAQQSLSVQVHPDDAYALPHEGKYGKSEAWYILDAVPGAKLVCGLDTRGRNPRSVLQSGRLEKYLCWISVRPGDVIYIPAGTVHALGPGIQCYEIQQSSDVTYRLWDWGRTGADGRPRELHIRQALDVISSGTLPGPARKKTVQHAGGTSVVLVDDPHFQLSSVDLDGSFRLPSGRMLFLTPFSTCTVCWSGHSQQVAAFRSVLVPARLSGVTVTGSGRMLMARAM